VAPRPPVSNTGTLARSFLTDSSALAASPPFCSRAEA
jgi:hypothetical protein